MFELKVDVGTQYGILKSERVAKLVSSSDLEEKLVSGKAIVSTHQSGSSMISLYTVNEAAASSV